MTNRRESKFVERTTWLHEQLEADRLVSEEVFRRERMQEPLEAYLDAFEEVQDAVENLLESTIDLSLLNEQALNILTDSPLLEAFRYLPGPPISLDDLKTLAEARSLAPKVLTNDPEAVQRLLETIHAGLDRRRFPWVTEGREPTQAERDAAILATTALIATQRVATSRRTESKKAQEERVSETLKHNTFRKISIPGNKIRTLHQSPQPGEFCGEVTLGTRKADLIVGLWDGRIMPIECKVSNSATNSVKRLNNDAAVKAGIWTRDFGTEQVAPTAVLSGVYNLRNLIEAQDRGLTIYWAHRLTDLVTWINLTH